MEIGPVSSLPKQQEGIFPLDIYHLLRGKCQNDEWPKISWKYVIKFNWLKDNLLSSQTLHWKTYLFTKYYIFYVFVKFTRSIECYSFHSIWDSLLNYNWQVPSYSLILIVISFLLACCSFATAFPLWTKYRILWAFEEVGLRTVENAFLVSFDLQVFTKGECQYICRSWSFLNFNTFSIVIQKYNWPYQI